MGFSLLYSSDTNKINVSDPTSTYLAISIASKDNQRALARRLPGNCHNGCDYKSSVCMADARVSAGRPHLHF